MFFCKQNNIKLSIVDAGVNYDFAPNLANLVSAKVGKGTESLLYGPSHEPRPMKRRFEKNC
jgi:nicotinate-nucleotide--dimethylbenzimidazole phosphoribosyltransferase